MGPLRRQQTRAKRGIKKPRREAGVFPEFSLWAEPDRAHHHAAPGAPIVRPGAIAAIAARCRRVTPAGPVHRASRAMPVVVTAAAMVVSAMLHMNDG